jgi:hypothetical protein
VNAPTKLWYPPHMGVVPDMPHEAYLATVGLSRSELVRLLDTSPYHVHAGQQDPDVVDAELPADEPTTPAKFAGTLLHCMLVEPDRFFERYAIGPEVKTRAAVAWKEFVKAHPGRKAIKPSQAELAHAQAEALRKTPMGEDPEDGTLGDLVLGATCEATGFWRDRATGLLCKCRPDIAVTVGVEDSLGDVLVDVKTTANAKRDAFNKSITPYGYDMQDAFYSAGWHQATGRKVHTFIFACVESAFPHATALYTLPEEWRAYGWKRCREALDLYAECQRRGIWPGYGIGVQELEPPRWHPIARDFFDRRFNDHLYRSE